MYGRTESLFCMNRVFHSSRLKRFTSNFSESAFLVLRPDDQNLGLISLLDGQVESASSGFPIFSIADHGLPSNVSSYHLSDGDVQALNTTFGLSGNEAKAGFWVAMARRFQDGACECLALRLAPSQDIAAIQAFLENVWPVLREDCLSEAQELQMTLGDDALLWMASDRIDVAILVLDEDCRIIRCNSAAREVLGSREILSEIDARVVASTPSGTEKLRKALHNCLHSDDSFEHSEEILCLSDESQGARVPVSLSRYHHFGQSTNLVVAMLPMPPNPERVELLGRKLGLTPAEARVAVLMQSGLTNREAACRAGLKEQTFNTYAKRVLCKLNVTGRTEMAQLLTWQSAGRWTA